jgi:hypothetical protein
LDPRPNAIKPSKAPLIWWLVVALAIPAFVVDVLARAFQKTEATSAYLDIPRYLSILLVPAIQLGVLVRLRVHRPFAHGAWVGVFSGVAWVIAGLLWLVGESVTGGTWTGFAYVYLFVFALGPEIVPHALILGGLTKLIVDRLPRRPAAPAAPPPPEPPGA